MAMYREPRTSPIIPAYGELTLADLSASLLASLSDGTQPGEAFSGYVSAGPGAGNLGLGGPGVADQASGNSLGLPSARRACLLLVDGMGWEQLRAHQAAAPFLSELAFNSRPMTCGFPSTTVTSLASLGTGLPPGEHGMLGLQ